MLSSSEPWPPVWPDVAWSDELLKPENLEVLAIGGTGYVYQCRGNLVYKVNSMQREFDMMRRAGDCAIQPVGRVMEFYDGRPVMSGLLTELEAPLDLKSVEKSGKTALLMEEMAELVATLHKTCRMIHGDIKPSNMLRCRDGKLRLCDFDSARPIDEDAGAWEGTGGTDQYMAPNRDYFYSGSPPTESDDNYALGITLWELYTGKIALGDELHNIEEILRERRTVDVLEVEDQDVRTLIRGLLRQGGANV